MKSDGVRFAYAAGMALALFCALGAAAPASAQTVYHTTSALTIPGGQVPWQMLFNTGAIPAGSTATLSIDVASVVDGDNRDFLYCGSTYLWTTAGLAGGGTFTHDVSSCVAGLDLTSTSSICSENAWNSTCSGGFYYGTASSDVVLNSATLTITTPAPPVISAIASTTNQTTATITWTTDKSASSTVSYGATSSYGSATTSAAFVTSHSLLITGLNPGTTYHYQISSADSSNRLATSSDLTFTTVAASSINPVGYWPLDEGSSAANAIDAIATNTGFQTGTPGVSTDTPPVNFTDTGSRVFDGNNYFTINRPVQDNFTICAWVKTTSAGGGTNHWESAPIMDSEVGGLAYDFGFGIGNGGRLMYGNGGTFDFQVNGTTVINDNHWHNVCATRNGGTGAVKLYVDAQLDGSGTTSTGTLNQNAHARIGYGYDGAAHYVGLIDDVRTYGTDLSQTQLQSLFQGNADPSTPPDSTAPAISGVSATPATTTAAIAWSTDEDASTRVVYSADNSYASSTPTGDTSPRVTSHAVSLDALVACTLYNYEVVSADAAGNDATSSSASFITGGCPGSATPTSATSTAVSVSAAATSTVSDSGRTLTVATPANFTATSSSVVIQIKGLPSATVLDSIGVPGSLTSAASVAFDVTALIDNATVLDSFDAPVTITYQYTDADIEGLDESTLAMYHYHDGSWLPLDDCSVDAAANTISCDAPSFSTFAIFGSPLAGASGSHSAHSGTSVQAQVANLEAMGKAAEADALKRQWSWLFPASAQAAAAGGTCPRYAFTRTLRSGNEGEDVRALQKFLNCAGFKLADAGPGSPGNETTYFVGRTLDALIRFQEAYAANVLVPIGAQKGTGIFAEYSQKQAGMLMGS
ncbi:MAG TPA: LamG-like jellyroll fold domain-containing protein [Candidatus Paceibacterota bacterium]